MSEERNDFEEITLAITLLAGILSFLLFISNYSNTNIISLSHFFQQMIYILIYFAIIIFLLLFVFLMLKGYAITAHSDNVCKISRGLLKNIFEATIIWTIYLISIILAYIVIINVDQKWYSGYVIVAFICLVVGTFATTTYYFYFEGIENVFGIACDTKPIYLICYGIVTLFIFYLITISVGAIYSVPSYLLIGTYSIEEYSQPEISDNRIFVITETGITYKKIYIDLYKLDSPQKTFLTTEYSMIINGTAPESKNRYMNGTKYEGKYYIYLNTSNLTYGNYILYAEVTDDLTKNSTFGTNKKRVEKLFHVVQDTPNLALFNT